MIRPKYQDITYQDENGKVWTIPVDVNLPEDKIPGVIDGYIRAMSRRSPSAIPGDASGRAATADNFPGKAVDSNPAARFAGGLAENLDLVRGAQDVARHPIQAVKSALPQYALNPSAVMKKVLSAKTRTEALGHLLAGALPLGQIPESMGEQAAGGDVAGASGGVASLILPEALRKIIPAASASRLVVAGEDIPRTMAETGMVGRTGAKIESLASNSSPVEKLNAARKAQLQRILKRSGQSNNAAVELTDTGKPAVVDPAEVRPRPEVQPVESVTVADDVTPKIPGPDTSPNRTMVVADDVTPSPADVRRDYQRRQPIARDLRRLSGDPVSEERVVNLPTDEVQNEARISDNPVSSDRTVIRPREADPSEFNADLQDGPYTPPERSTGPSPSTIDRNGLDLDTLDNYDTPQLTEIQNSLKPESYTNLAAKTMAGIADESLANNNTGQLVKMLDAAPEKFKMILDATKVPFDDFRQTAGLLQKIEEDGTLLEKVEKLRLPLSYMTSPERNLMTRIGQAGVSRLIGEVMTRPDGLRAVQRFMGSVAGTSSEAMYGSLLARYLVHDGGPDNTEEDDLLLDGLAFAATIPFNFNNLEDLPAVFNGVKKAVSKLSPAFTKDAAKTLEILTQKHQIPEAALEKTGLLQWLKSKAETNTPASRREVQMMIEGLERKAKETDPAAFEKKALPPKPPRSSGVGVVEGVADDEPGLIPTSAPKRVAEPVLNKSVLHEGTSATGRPNWAQSGSARVNIPVRDANYLLERSKLRKALIHLHPDKITGRTGRQANQAETSQFRKKLLQYKAWEEQQAQEFAKLGLKPPSKGVK